MTTETELINHYGLTIDEVKEEVTLLHVDTIRYFPCTPSNQSSFYELWNRFGPDAARTAMIPYVWKGLVQRPSEFYGVELKSATKADVSSTSES
jgi:hypothetical protein